MGSRTTSDTKTRASGGLPRRLSTLIGRERELAEIGDRLGRTRLLTLTGAGGSGKTTLAIEVATRAQDAYSGGIFWVELAPLADASAVPRAIVLALGVQPLPSQSEQDAAAAFLASRQALLVVDNCEHLLDACAELCEFLLHRANELTVLATSRAPLSIPAESEWQVPPLSLPPAGASMELTGSSEAAALFTERARAVSSRFALTADNAGEIARICTRLDGMPLAIELAAARIRILSPREIADGLDDALGLASAGARTAEPRQRTLRASIEWSYDLLIAAQRRLLRRLAVFVGGFTLSLAETVCMYDEDRDEFLDLLGGLIEHSLVQVEDAGDATRYRLLETVRQFAAERLEESNEAETLQDRHRDALLEFAERQRELTRGPRQPEAFAALEREAANLLAAVERAIATDGEQARRLGVALALWFRHSGRLREGVEVVRAALDAGDEAPSSLRADALTSLVLIGYNLGEFEQGVTLASEALEMAEQLGDDRAAGDAMAVLGDIETFTDTARARPTLERGLEFGRRTANDWLVGRSVLMQATLDWFQQTHRPGEDPLAEHWDSLTRLGDRETLSYAHFVVGSACYATLEHETARDRLARAITVAREIQHPLAEDAARGMSAAFEAAAGRPQDALEAALAIRERLLVRGGIYYLAWVETIIGMCEAGRDRLSDAALRLKQVVAGQYGTIATPLTWAQAELARVLVLMGEDEASQTHAERGLQAARRLGNPWHAAQCQLALGEIATNRGDWARAEARCHEGLAAIADRGLRIELPRALEDLATAAAGLESHTEAARILGAADRARGERGPIAWPAEARRIGTLTERLQGALGSEEFEAAFAEGAALSDEEAVAWLRRARGERTRPAGGWESLTPTELEVVRHVAAGLTNPQIGERMFVSRSTVKTHLAHIYAKLGIANRVELAREAERRRR